MCIKKFAELPKTIIQSKGKYINQHTLLQCFRPNKTTHVDKLECGNGFTTAFLNNPPPPNQINILIAPNKAVVIGKEQEYKIKQLAGSKTLPTKFFYKGSQDYNFDDAKILVFVADSFLIYKRSLVEIKERINFILIDEYHSTETQSTFRNNLINFIANITKIVGSAPAVTTITATPLLFSQIDIKIRLLERTPTNRSIVVSNDENNAVERMKTLLNANEKVVLFTNSLKVIQKFKHKNKLEANFIVGTTMMGNLVEDAEIIQNDRSNLIICTSRGFEGFDIYGGGFNIFYFEDRSRPHTTFYASNLYQAINRTRDGYKYAEYVRLELSTNRNLYLTKNRVNDISQLDKKIQRFANRSNLSNEQKQSTEYKDYKPFLIFTANKSGGFDVDLNQSRINLEKELHIFDNQNFFNSDFKQFFEERNISFIDARTAPRRVNKNNNSIKDKRNFLKINQDLISALGLFDNDYFIIPERTDEPDKALKKVRTYLRRKNYNGTHERSGVQLMVLSFLKNNDDYNKLISKVISAHALKQHEKHTRRDAEKNISKFKDKANGIVLELLQSFANENLYFRKKIIAHRDYNILTELGISQIEIITGAVGLSFKEVDIRTCYPRLLYALNGLGLPSNFYGDGKINKRKINVLLNDFMFNPKQSTPLKIQKVRAKTNLLNAGIDPKVTSYLIEHFFQSKFRGNLFNFLAYFEKQLIDKLKLELREKSIKSIFRRHDSLVVFDPNFLPQYQIRDFEFLDQKGWFLDEVKEAKILEEIDFLF